MIPPNTYRLWYNDVIHALRSSRYRKKDDTDSLTYSKKRSKKVKRLKVKKNKKKQNKKAKG